MSEPVVTWVEDEAALEQAVAACGSVVALDTEFQRTSTFFPVPGLYQLASDEHVWLIDPLSIERYDPFVDLLEDPRVTVVMHACTEDLELLRHHLGASPRTLFDTQLAHAYLSDRFSISYAGLVEGYLGHDLPQSQTRSNWLRRPLSDAQKKYAANDVIHLPTMYSLLTERLAADGRLDWFVEDMVERSAYESPDPSRYYQSVGRAWMLEDHELARLQALCQWREETAMQLDVPRKRVVWDEHLVALARSDQVTAGLLREVLPAPVVGRFGDALIETHEQADDQAPPVRRPLTQSEGKFVKRLRHIGAQAAERLGLAQELLARKRDLEQLFRHFADNRELDAKHQGWRRGVVGDAFMQMLEEHVAS